MTEKNREASKKLSRRKFLKLAGLASALGLGAGYALAEGTGVLDMLEPAGVTFVDNPIDFYPERGWETLYRDQYAYDYKARTVCSPNCTHSCDTTVYIRNGVAIRTEQSYNVEIADVDVSWNPRGCLKGYTLVRRFYGPTRIRYPMVRVGYSERYKRKDGSMGMRALPQDKRKGMRGDGKWMRVSWDEVYELIARKIIEIAEDEKNVYTDPETGIKFDPMKRVHVYPAIRAAGMVTRHSAASRFDSVLGCSEYTEYDWYADLPPGHTITHGYQTSDHEASDWRNAQCVLSMGKNLIENKLAENHFLTESLERGSKIIVVSPDYQATNTRADLWITLRPGTDGALLLGIANQIFKNDWFDRSFVAKYTCLPFLVRQDTMKYLRNCEVDSSASVKFDHTVRDRKIRQEKYVDKKWWGDFVVWDKKTNGPVRIKRDELGEKMPACDPVLRGTFKVKLTDGSTVEAKSVFQMQEDYCSYFTPEHVAEITECSPEALRKAAHMYSHIKPAAIHQGEGINHWFYQNLTQRAAFLVSGLTGNLGQSGGGVSNWSGQYKGSNCDGVFKIWWKIPIKSMDDIPNPEYTKKWIDYPQINPAHTHIDPETGKTETTLTLHHQPIWTGYAMSLGGRFPLDPAAVRGFDRVRKRDGNFHDIRTKTEIDKALDPDNAVTSGYNYLFNRGKSYKYAPPKLWWTLHCNFLNQTKGQPHVLRSLVKQNHDNDKTSIADPENSSLRYLDTVITSDIEMTFTCDNSDIVLPVTSWFELDYPDISVGPPIPFIQLQQGVHPKICECKQDIDHFANVLKWMDRIYSEDYSRQTKYAKTAFPHILLGDIDEARKKGDKQLVEKIQKTVRGYIQDVLDAGVSTRGLTVERLEKGPALLNMKTYPRIPFWDNVHLDEPIYTKTGRFEYYKEEDKFIGLEENLIVYKESVEYTPYGPGMQWPMAKDFKNPHWEKGYQFYYNTPHGRHSVHSSWRMTDWNLIWSSDFGTARNTNQREYVYDRANDGDLKKNFRSPLSGEPQIEINTLDGKELGIEEGDYVLVYNDRGSFIVRAKLNPRMRRKQSTIYHGWWPKSFVKGSWQSVTPLLINPVQETDDLVHKEISGQSLEEGYSPQVWAPTGVNRDCAVAIRKVSSLDEALSIGRSAGIPDLKNSFLGSSKSINSPVDLPDVYVASNLKWRAPKWQARGFASGQLAQSFLLGDIQ
ncbi:MAG: molybdopterin-dependent oxidoreductase, partial [Candidatus Obscuribacterales bacterium]|nr:molybdopterin-dependent oxidoreductase [Candidatus Obscuribacterales bacterium]